MLLQYEKNKNTCVFQAECICAESLVAKYNSICTEILWSSSTQKGQRKQGETLVTFLPSKSKIHVSFKANVFVKKA